MISPYFWFHVCPVIRFSEQTEQAEAETFCTAERWRGACRFPYVEVQQQ